MRTTYTQAFFAVSLLTTVCAENALRRKRDVVQIEEVVYGSSGRRGLGIHSTKKSHQEEKAPDDILDMEEDIDMIMMSSMSMSMGPATTDPTMTPAVPTMTPAPTPSPAPALPTLPAASMTPSSPPALVDPCSNATRVETIGAQLVDFVDVDTLTDMTTPQGKAFLWLVDEDPAQVDPCTYPTILERFALATLYFATGGDSWTVSTEWMTATEECSWFGVTCTTSVTSILLCKCFFGTVFGWNSKIHAPFLCSSLSLHSILF
jgi:hypothetical protein